MTKTTLKYFIGVAIMFSIDSLHWTFFENNNKYDVYLFYSHSRYFTNILYDISVLFKTSLLSYWLIKLNKKVFKPLFLISLLTWVFYFTFYNQKISLTIVPLYISLSVLYNKNILK